MKRFVGIVTGLVLFAAFTTVTFAQDKAALMTKGQKVYNEYCKTCHQANGQGLGAAFPPLANDSIPQASIAGLEAALTGFATDEDIAAVVTYVYNSWGNSGPVVKTADVKKHKKK